MTETVCNPNHFRKDMTELLFECYQTPKLIYGIDAMFSLYANDRLKQDNFIISGGNLSTTIIPYFGSKVAYNSIRKLAFGGFQAAEYLLKLMQTKYPQFPSKMTFNQAQHLFFEYSQMATNYMEELKYFIDEDKFSEMDVVVQFPYPQESTADAQAKEEERSRLMQKRKEQALKMKEIALEKRKEKLTEKECDLANLTALKESKEEYEGDGWKGILKKNGLANEKELESKIKNLQDAVNALRVKIFGDAELPKDTKEKYDFSILDIPDAELSELEVREKRRLRLIKSSIEARERMKKEKEEHQLQLEKEEQWRMENPAEWISEMQAKRKDLKERIKNRKQLKKDLLDRKSHASYLKMKTLAQLTNEAMGIPSAPVGKKRKKGDSQPETTIDEEGIEMLKELDDSDAEERDELELDEVESLLEKHDPSFQFEDEIPFTIVDLLKTGKKKAEYHTKDYHQIHYNVERMRVPEVLFQPHIVGIDQAGITEMLENSFKVHPMQNVNVFLTGGTSLIKGFSDRLSYDLRQYLPIQAALNIHKAKDPVLDAWKGAAKFSSSSDSDSMWISKKDYEEYGGEYIKESWFSNQFYKDF